MSHEDIVLMMLKHQHQKFGIAYDGPPRRLSSEEKTFRHAALAEEVAEFGHATSIVEEYDALLDLIVFAVGTLERMGLPLEIGLSAVVTANLKKERGPNKKRGGFELDLVKPEGWEGPEELLGLLIKSFGGEIDE